jgi:tricorn protease
MRYSSMIVVFLILSIQFLLGADEGRFMRYPAVHHDKIVFTYEGDLWSAPSSGGIAVRLTSFPGDEFSARFSPDGKTIAFTASYDGPQTIYSMPAEGGIPLRLTYAVGTHQSIGWTPDGQKVIFRSYMDNVIGRTTNLYFVSKTGSAPERFPIDRGTLCSFSADGKKMLYVRKGNEEYNWKGYKGGEHTDIWLYDFEKNSFTPITDYVGKNAYPMWIGDAMYFVSDRTDRVANIYKYDFASKQVTQITKYTDVDVIRPETDGSQIIYLHDGYLNILDVATGQYKKISITIPSDRWALRDRTINPKEYIHSISISNNDSTVVLEARGDIFTVGTEKGKALNLSNTPGSHEMYPQLSPDGKWVAFFSDKTGEYQLYKQKIDGGEWVPLTTTLDRTNYKLLWSPDGKKILFGNKDYAIQYIDVDSKKITRVDASNQMKNDEFYWEIADYNWSPDSKWICYSFVQANRNSQIFLYSLEQGKKFAISDDFYDNLNPCFDAKGKYLYYISSQNYDVQMDFYEDNHVLSAPQKIMVVQLQDNEPPPFADPVPEKKPAAEGFRIDINGIRSRITPLPGSPGNFFFLKAGSNKIAWCSVDKFTEDEYEEIFKPGGATKWDLHIFDMKSKKEAVLGDKIREFVLSPNGENILVRREKDLYTSSLDDAYKSKSIETKLNLDKLMYTVDIRKEWNQIFNDTWRWYRDFFYDKNMHGRDWKMLGDRYRAYIPHLSSREELNWVLVQMVGELSVSHTYIGGGDNGPSMKTENPLFTGWLGADLVPDQSSRCYKFQTIYGPTELNMSITTPLARPDIDVKEGDYLLAINGTEVRVPDDYYKLLQIIEGQKVTITVNSKPSLQGARTYEVSPIRNSSTPRYYRWLTNNMNKVLAATNGKVGYLHINAMGSEGIAEFDKFWRAFRYKEGVILDVRRNSGGWTEYFIIDKLERKMTSYNVLQGMVPFRYPGSAGNGNYVAISNEYNGSDGEAFIEDFKANKLGEVVGVPSWGGLVGILNRQTTIDNGSVEQSNNAFYGEDGKWLVENHGADPTILIDNDPASVMAGKDPQLDKAIETILDRIKKNPFTFPATPAYPKK